MKLINLEIEGLNSFKNKAVIDFKPLFDKGFFGVFGATGSGKSSILDAVFFALYGNVLRSKNEFEFVNINKKSVKVKLVFEMRDKGVDKTFEVIRNLKLNQTRTESQKDAQLYLINGDEKTLLATGDEKTTEKISEIVGFGENEFRRFIALPQGQFSQFLKDSPKEKIETMAKLFNLEKYGDELSDKLKEKRAENLKRKAYLKGVLDQYANVDAGVISAEKSQVLQLKKQKKVKEKEYFDLKNDYLDAERNFELIKEKQKFDEKLKELSKNDASIQKDTENLAILKATFALHPLFSKLKQLKEDKANLEAEHSKIGDEINATNNAYVKAVALNDKSKTEISVKLAGLERRQSLLLAIRQDAERYHLLEKQKADLEKQIEKDRENVDRLKGVYDSHSLSLENNLNIIADLEQFVVHDNIEGNVIDAVSEFARLKAYAEALKLSIADFKAEKTQIQSRKEALLKELVENDEKLNSYKAQIAKTNDALKEMFTADISLSKAIVNATNKLAFLKLQGTDYIENEVEIQSLSKQAAALLKQIKDEQKLQETIKADLEKVKADITESASAEKIDKEQIKKLKELQKQLGVSLSDSKQNEMICDEKRDFILVSISKKQKTQKELQKQDELFVGLTFEKLEGKILAAENKLYKLIDLSTSLDKAKESAQAKERSCVKISAAIDEIAKEESILDSKLQNLEKTFSNATKKIDEFEKLNKEGTLKSAQAYDENFNSQIIVLNQQKGVIPQIIKFVNLKQAAADKYFDAKSKLDSKQTKFEQTSLDMKVILNKLRELNVKGYIKDEIANNFSNIDSLRTTLKNITDSESEILRKEAKLKIQKASLVSELVIKEEEIENTSKTLKGECKLAGVSEEDLLKEIVYDDIVSLEQKINKFNEEKSSSQAESDRLKGLITNKTMTQAKLLSIHEKLLKCERSALNLSSEIDFLEKQIQKDEENVKKLAYFKAELDETLKQEEIFAKLTELNSNDAILKFLTEEYILLITEKANTYFATLTNGRFQLVYSGDFLVVDNINGGLTRSVGTLSGGETFLASLSLAIAIVETISLLHDKPLDFVFLDEGFGTLDENSIEMVMTAFRKFRQTKLVFGLITHEELVKFKTPTRIEVYKSADEGSRIETVI